MADLSPESAELRAVRDRLAAQLQLLDALGESLAAIELDLAIEFSTTGSEIP